MQLTWNESQLRTTAEIKGCPDDVWMSRKKDGDQVAGVFISAWEKGAGTLNALEDFVNHVDVSTALDSKHLFEFTSMLIISLEHFPTGILYGDTVADIYYAAYMLILAKYDNHKRTISGRISTNDINYDCDQNFLLCEGFQEAFSVILELDTVSKGVFNDQKIFGMGGHRVPALNTLLAYDDMNIRGVQLMYAADYVDRDFQKLAKLIQRRDSTLLEYINKRSAEDITDVNPKVTQHYVAVSGGASATEMSTFGNLNRMDVVMDVISAGQYLMSEVEPLKMDYASMDIVDGTDPELAVRIAQAHGFELVMSNSYKDKWSAGNTRYIFYNKETKDFLVATSNTKSITYGGCRILAARDNYSGSTIFGPVKGNISHFTDKSGFIVYECDHREGPIFNMYKHLVPSSNEYDPSCFPHTGSCSLPLLKYMSSETFFNLSRDLPDELRGTYFTTETYFIEEIINIIMMWQNYDTVVPSELNPYYRFLKDDIVAALYDISYFTNRKGSDLQIAMRLAAAYTGIDNDTLGQWYNNTLELLEAQRAANPDNKWFANISDNWKDFPWSTNPVDKYVLSFFIKDYPVPSVEELDQVALAWCKANAPEAYKQYSDFALYAELYPLYIKQKNS